MRLRTSVILLVLATLSGLPLYARAAEQPETSAPSEGAEHLCGIRATGEASWGRLKLNGADQGASEPQVGIGVGGVARYRLSESFTFAPSVSVISERFDLKPPSSHTVSSYWAIKLSAGMTYKVAAWFEPEVGFTVSQGISNVTTDQLSGKRVVSSTSSSFGNAGLNSLWVNGYVAATFPVRFATWSLIPAVGYELGLTNRSKASATKITVDSVVVRIDFLLW